MLVQSTQSFFGGLKTYKIFPWSGFVNIVQKNYLRNVDPWLTGNFYEKNNLYSVGLTRSV